MDTAAVSAPGSVRPSKPSGPKALISWSSGKDSAFALHEVRRTGEFDVVGALDHGDRDVRPGVDPRRAPGNPARATRRRGPAATDRADPLSLPERDLRSADGRSRCASGAPTASRTSSSAISSSPISAPIASRSSPAPASRRCFRCGSGRPLPLARAMIASGLEAHLATVDLKKLPAEFAGRRFDAVLAGRFARRRRSLRRERRVSHLRGGGADVFAATGGGDRRTRRARWLCVLRSGDRNKLRRPGQASVASAEPGRRESAARLPQHAIQRRQAEDDRGRDQRVADRAE